MDKQSDEEYTPPIDVTEALYVINGTEPELLGLKTEFLMQQVSDDLYEAASDKGAELLAPPVRGYLTLLVERNMDIDFHRATYIVDRGLADAWRRLGFLDRTREYMNLARGPLHAMQQRLYLKKKKK